MKNIPVKKLLFSIFIFLTVIILALGVFTIVEVTNMGEQMETMYQHPYTVRNAFYEMKISALNTQVHLRNLSKPENEAYQEELYLEIQNDYSVIETSLVIIQNNYLGPQSDIDAVEQAYSNWKAYRSITIQYYMDKDYTSGDERIRVGALGEEYKATFFEKIDVIDVFSASVADRLFVDSMSHAEMIILATIILTSLIVLTNVVLDLVIYRNISTPLNALSNAASKVEEGNYSVRSEYYSKNEFGNFSRVFNQMISSSEKSIMMNQKVASFSSSVIQAGSFIKSSNELIHSLNSHLGSLGSLLYIANENEELSLVASIGIKSQDLNNISLLELNSYIEELNRKDKYKVIKNLTQDSTLILSNLFETFLPKEIIMIPVYIGNKMIGLIASAKSDPFTEDQYTFIDKIYNTITARIEGIMFMSQSETFLNQLEDQNKELEAQQTELTSMNNELEVQNSQLELQKEQLSLVNQHKTSFLSTMSHELRTPLNSVIALSGVLERQLKGVVSDENHEYIQVIERNGKHLLSLINDILDISRVESGRVELLYDTFSPCKVIKEITRNLKSLADAKNIQLNVHCDQEKFMMYSDEDKFVHIVQNLIGNAIKFTEKGSVSINSEIESDWLVINVIDTGIGIKQDALPYIFDEFRQVDASSSRKYGGTGLGLAIAKKYCSLLGGIIDVMSVYGKGTTFTLKIPLLNQSDMNIEKDEYPTKIRHTVEFPLKEHETKDILVIDDIDVMRNQMNSLLSENNYTVRLAEDYLSALSCIDKATPDLILLDLGLPQVDGFELLDKVRSFDKTKDIPVLVVTSRQISKDELKYLKRNNVHQYIQKGEVNENDFLNAIYSLLFKHNDGDSKVRKPASNSKNQVEKPLVLIVEDNPDNMITAVALLKNHFELIQAVNGLEAVQLSSKYHPDIILMDIALPIMNGIEAFEKIHEDSSTKNIPVIALTASALEDEREKILSHGFTAFITKPIVEKELLSKMKEVINDE